MLISYSIGVNSYIDDLNWDELPIEYKILDYPPISLDSCGKYTIVDTTVEVIDGIEDYNKKASNPTAVEKHLPW